MTRPPNSRPGIAARARAVPGNHPRKTLAGVVGAAVALALGVSIPADESGRKVEATLQPANGALQVRHISGRQYLRGYLDIVRVGTACDGITTYRGQPIRAGQQFTEAQCAEMLEDELVRHAEGVMACSPGLALSSDPAVERQRAGPRFAAVSLAYNVGIGRPASNGRLGSGYCGSTARAWFNAGAYPAGCDALLAWNKAGGREVRGLTERRRRERDVCRRGFG